MKYLILFLIGVICLCGCKNDVKKVPAIEFASDSIVIDAPVMLDSFGIHKTDDYVHVTLGDALVWDSVKGIVYIDPRYYVYTIDWKKKYDSLLLTLKK